MNWFQSQSVVLQAFLARLFTWGCTIVGSAIFFFFKHISRKLLDIMMGFAAGAMIFVVVEELIPDSQTNGNTDVATLGLMVGFVIMMILDVALG
ncbi:MULTISPECIES: ZIP family metal transporter [Streptococcus]|uniref:Putative gufA-like protein n=1 Tax=Streptococcus viridans TaxID=78535 RepID=A0A3S4M2U9_9STRE|nr:MULTISPECIES: zinc transporter [Streptococcus]VED67069.1 putative gufA-like protein [Streptococcus viridans]VEE19950.1 putative gufA-like protein [Streptococcus australis]